MVKDIVVEEDLNPEVDKPGRRMRLDAARNTSVEKEMPDIDWDKDSVPLVPTPGISRNFTLYNVYKGKFWDKESVPLVHTPGISRNFTRYIK